MTHLIGGQARQSRDFIMCVGGGGTQAQKFQTSKDPVFREQVDKRRGRRGTNLTSGTGVLNESQGGKKTLLGQ